jgi:hypothetical protein
MTAEERPDHRHPNIVEAGHCPDCRALAIEECHDGPHGFALAHYTHIYDPEPGQPMNLCECCDEPVTFDPERPDALTLLRVWSPVQEDAIATAWATGCNAGAGIAIVGPLPAETIEGIGLPLFTLITGADAVAAWQLIEAGRRSHRIVNSRAQQMRDAWDEIDFDIDRLHRDALDALHELAGEMRVAIEEEWARRDDP